MYSKNPVTEKLISQIKEISHGANDIALSYHFSLKENNLNDKNFAFLKDDQSPVTKADLKISDFICKNIKKISSFPIISEENTLLGGAFNCDTFWLIDPIDGTKEFLSGQDDFTINIALIHKAISVFGLIYAPAYKSIYYGSNEFGSFKEDPQINKLSVSIPKSEDIIKILSSKNHESNEAKQFMQQFRKKEIKNMGSSLKFCLIAEGLAHLYPRFGNTYEWDTAAGQAILENAGGYVKNLDTGLSMKYDKKLFANPYFNASSFIL